MTGKKNGGGVSGGFLTPLPRPSCQYTVLYRRRERRRHSSTAAVAAAAATASAAQGACVHRLLGNLATLDRDDPCVRFAVSRVRATGNYCRHVLRIIVVIIRSYGIMIVF